MRRKDHRRILLVALLAVLVALPLSAPAAQAAPAFKDTPVLPEGPTGARIKSFLELVNSADVDRLKRFLSDECGGELRKIPLADHVATLLGLARDTGGVDFFSVRTFTPERAGETVVVARDRALGGYWAFVFRFGEAPGFLVNGLAINNARPPAGIVEPPLTQSQAVAEIKALVDRLVKTGWYSGTVLVAKGAEVLMTGVGGEASKAFHVPNNIDTKFNLGSMNKMFTSIAVARLVEAGKLAWDDPISKWVDESWLPKSITGTITVRHLITHTSGLGSYFNKTYWDSSRALFRKLDDYKPLIKDEKPAFAPGSRYQYSNTGMFLLGVIIEKATGEDYFDHIRKTVYAPAGMTSSDCYELDYPIENLAIGYSPDFASPYKWQNNLYKHVLKGGPAGGGFSTVKDLHQFALALLAGRFVSTATRDMMWTDFKGARYGYGFTVAEGPDGKVVGHSGGFPGINSQLDIRLGSGYIVAAMCNYNSGASLLAGKIGAILSRVK